MNTARLLAVLLLLAMFCLPAPGGLRAEGPGHDYAPLLNQGRKWRIGYLQGGHYVDYPLQLAALVQGLMELGWIERAPLPPVPSETPTARLWAWLHDSSRGPWLDFVPDAYYDNQWDKRQREENRARILARLRSGELDMMIAMGTWAGQDLATDDHQVPVMVMSTSNPILSGIIKSAEDSGRDNIHAKVDPLRYIRQVELFHELVGFTTLGLVYENTVEGRTYSALADVETVASRRGFRILTCEAPHAGVDEETAARAVARCHRILAPRVDALYITSHNGVDKKYMRQLMAPLLEHQVPTWSQRGAEEVRYGALMSFARADFSDVGLFQARVMARILRGEKPRDIPQIFHDPREALAFNLRTAQLIGYNPPLDLLAAADQIFEQIAVYRKQQDRHD